MNTQSTPEYYGYTIGQNIAPYINKCIENTKECYLSAGTHIVGRNDYNYWGPGNVYNDSIITWGWGPTKTDVKIIGAGKDKTILRFADDVQSRRIYGSVADYVFMLQPKYDESCDNLFIDGITWDGNYTHNSGSSTINGIRARGKNITIQNCKFIDFGVGANQKSECFELTVGPVVNSDKGPYIYNNTFTKPGAKSNSPAGFVPEHTYLGIWGSDIVVDNNEWIDCIFDVKTQQSPLHAMTIGPSKNAKLTNNKFNNFQGGCVYMDSWTNDGAIVTGNTGYNVWEFIQLTCQTWGDPNQISTNTNFNISKNNIQLSSNLQYYEWDKPGSVSSFFGYCYDPSLDTAKYKGFQNIVAENNNVLLGTYKNTDGTVKYSDKLICYWGNSVGPDKINVSSSNKFVTSSMAFNALTASIVVSPITGSTVTTGSLVTTGSWFVVTGSSTNTTATGSLISITINSADLLALQKSLSDLTTALSKLIPKT